MPYLGWPEYGGERHNRPGILRLGGEGHSNASLPLLSFYSNAAREPIDSTRRLANAEHIKRVTITRLEQGRHLSAAVPSHLEAPYGRSINAAFSAFGNDYNFNLHLHDTIFAPGAVVRTQDERGREVVHKPIAQSYVGRTDDGSFIRATIHDDNTMHCAWVEKGEVHMLAPVTTYRRSAPELVSQALARGTRMLALKGSDLKIDEHSKVYLDALAKVTGRGADESTRRELWAMTGALLRPVFNSAAPYGVMPNCPSALKRFPIGLAADVGYFEVSARWLVWWCGGEGGLGGLFTVDVRLCLWVS